MMSVVTAPTFLFATGGFASTRKRETTFRHATWGPDELFYGELYTSRRVPCTPTLARPGTRDEYSACCGRELAENVIQREDHVQ